MADESATPQVQLYHGDCLEVMPTLPANSVSMVFCDLPYGVTNCKWDCPIDLAPLWQQLDRLLCADAIVCATSTLRFATALLASASLKFKYDLIWHKSRASGFLNAKKAPLRSHELILVFSKGKPAYAPQMHRTWRPVTGQRVVGPTRSDCYRRGLEHAAYTYGEWRYPTSVIEPIAPKTERGMHPTQKPVALLEWLIKTYTNSNDTVLDPVMGSGSCGVACLRTGRRFIGIEKDATYFAVARDRIKAEQARLAPGG